MTTTPGPWVVRDTGHSTMPYGIDAKTGVDGYWLARVWRQEDARLIAAAPEMLRLLKLLTNDNQSTMREEAAKSTTRALLAKIEGKE